MRRGRESDGSADSSELEVRGSAAPGRRTLTEQLQRRGGGAGAELPAEDAHATAARGLTGSPGALPHLGRIQESFGSHDVRGVPAFVGGPAREASAALGASAYAADGEVAFGAEPDLHTAAHEAAHVVQQRGGVQLAGGVGASGNPYERHADQVADRVVAGESAQSLLDGFSSGGAASSSSTGVQRKMLQLHDPDAGVPLPGGLATPDVPTLMTGSFPMSAQLAADALSHYRGSADKHDWWARYSGRAVEVLETAAPAEVAPGGPSGATAAEWLGRLGQTPTNATLALRLGHTSLAVSWAMTAAVPMTTVLATAAITEYQGLNATGKDAWFARFYPRGQVPALLRAVPGAASPGGGAFHEANRDLLRRIQRTETDAATAEVGLTDHAGMVDAEAAHLRANPGVVVREHNAVHGAAPTPMSAAQAAVHNTRINAQIPAFVTHMQHNQPEIGMTLARIRADAAACYANNDAIAFAEQSTGIAVVGRRFADMCERNVAYAVPTVVHELHGHNEYGEYGVAGTEAGFDLYNEARTRPGMPAALTEEVGVGSFGYIETEIYSVLRENDYYTPNSAADDQNRPGQRAITENYNAQTGIEMRLRAARRLFDERVATAQLRGLYRRLRADPHFAPRTGPMRAGVLADPLDHFRAAVRTVYPTRAATILQ